MNTHENDERIILVRRGADGKRLPQYPPESTWPPSFGDAEYYARRTLNETPEAASVAMIDAVSGQVLVIAEREQ